MRLGQVDAARSDLETAIKLAPDWGLPYLNRGQLAHALGDLDAAISDYSRAIDQLLKPEEKDLPLLARVYWNRGQAYRSRGDEERAQADLREAVLRDPSLASP